MPVDKGKSGKPRDKHDSFVPAVFARDAEEAVSYSELLRDHDIPAVCGISSAAEKEDGSGEKNQRRGITHGVPVLVPEDLLDEASEVIADRENLSEFKLDDIEEDEDEEEEEMANPEELNPDIPDQFDEEDEDDLLEDDLDEDE